MPRETVSVMTLDTSKTYLIEGMEGHWKYQMLTMTHVLFVPAEGRAWKGATCRPSPQTGTG